MCFIFINYTKMRHIIVIFSFINTYMQIINKKLINKITKQDSNFDLINFTYPIIDYIVPLKYSPNRKYTNKYFFICLVNFIESGATVWTRYNGTVEYPISGKYLNQIHNYYVNNGVYNAINTALVKKYLSTGKEMKL